VFLVDDTGEAGGPFVGLVLPGSATIQNSQCTIKWGRKFGDGEWKHAHVDAFDHVQPRLCWQADLLFSGARGAGRGAQHQPQLGLAGCGNADSALTMT
jgi:hypothetical protein